MIVYDKEDLIQHPLLSLPNVLQQHLQLSSHVYRLSYCFLIIYLFFANKFCKVICNE